MLTYTTIYYTAIFCSLACLPVFFAKQDKFEHRNTKAAITLVIIMVYLAAMLRNKGVDVGNYRDLFLVDSGSVSDVGFAFLIKALNAVGAPFFSLLLVSGIVSIVALNRAAKYFHVSFALLLVFWFAHIAVVRDFSQFRVGFAVSIAVIGLTSRLVWFRLLCYAAAAMMHFTSMAFILSYEYYRFVLTVRSQRLRYFFVACSIVGIFLMGKGISYLAFLDPRIEIYLKWQQSGYGLPVETYGFLILHLIVLSIAILGWRGWHGNRNLETLVYMQMLGIFSFIAFSAVSIFAFRISNVVLSLYPVLLIHSFNAVRMRWGPRPANRLASGLIAFAVIAILVVRPGSFDIIKAIGF